jgi:hypothetical protein
MTNQDEQIKRLYITLPAAVDRIKAEVTIPKGRVFNLNTLYRWRSNKLISQRYIHKLTIEEFNKLKQLVILHYIVGVKAEGLLKVEKYIRERNQEYMLRVFKILDLDISKQTIKRKIKELYVKNSE